MKPTVLIYSNTKPQSQSIKTELTNKLNKHQIEIVDEREQPDFIISIGGDGTFLSAFHHFEQ